MPALLFVVLIVTIAVLAYKSNIPYEYRNFIEKSTNGTGAVPSLRNINDSDVPVEISGMNSPHAILVRLKDHTIMMQKNSNERIYPASLTKIMTAIVSIEKLPDLHEKIKLPNTMFKELYKEDASMAVNWIG